MNNFTMLGENILAAVEGDKLTLVIDLSEDLGPSSSGKTNIVASTRGSLVIPNHPHLKLGLNLFKGRRS